MDDFDVCKASLPGFGHSYKLMQHLLGRSLKLYDFPAEITSDICPSSALNISLHQAWFRRLWSGRGLGKGYLYTPDTSYLTFGRRDPFFLVCQVINDVWKEIRINAANGKSQ